MEPSRCFGKSASESIAIMKQPNDCRWAVFIIKRKEIISVP